MKRSNMMYAKLPASSATVVLIASVSILCMTLNSHGQTKTKPDPRDAKIKHLEQMIHSLDGQVRQLRTEQQKTAEAYANRDEVLKSIREDLDEMPNDNWFDPDSWLARLRIGSYGEMHANYAENGGADQFDIHRLV
ncbi:MAG TPA: hypothetical protein ENL03_04180, partial [Phycisphaerae bacterium]|nr:hypothetical protein [Phycisphaerae bacterium]